MVSVKINIDLPEDVAIASYHRLEGGHGFEVTFPLPKRVCCQRCRREDKAYLEYKNTMQVIRDLDILTEPTFWVYQPVFHRCPYCGHRQSITPPFKRKDTSYTLRFEQHVLRLLIGSNEEEVARRLGISAETVALIVRNQLADAKDQHIDPDRVITDVGIDEISLKKRHKLYVTILTDLTDPQQPQVLAVADGRDENAATQCLEKLSAEQRQRIQTYRADMSKAYHKAFGQSCPAAKAVVDRFHVAKNFNEAIDEERKKITRAYKAELSPEQRKQFRSRMWEFRRRPEDLSPEQKQDLEELFEEVPRLRTLYQFRIRFQKIFDETSDPTVAEKLLNEMFAQMVVQFARLDRFVCTFENWRQGILNYFQERKTSGPVEGINNKARVIVKRCYGIKSGQTLWSRLVLDLNRVRDAVMYTIQDIRQLVMGFRTFFTWLCT